MKHVYDMIRKCSRDTDKIYLYVKDPYEAKYQFLINNREDDGMRNLNDPKLLLNTQMIFKMSTKILINTI